MSPNRPEKNILQSLPLRTMTVRVTPAVLILLALTFMALHRMNTVPVERLRVAMMDSMTPILTLLSTPVNSFIDSIDGMSTLRGLKAENIQLREENAKLKQWYETALRLQAENKSFRDLLHVKADPTLNFVTSRVISDAGGTFVKSLLLPVGAVDQVQKGHAVMSGHGLIGRIIEVGDHSSRVLLVTDLNSRIPVMIQNTRTKAILAGKNQDLMKLERLPFDSGMTIGTRVVTSADGGQLPPNLPIGTIVSAGADGVWVKPISEIDQLTYVQVVNVEDEPLFIKEEMNAVDTSQPLPADQDIE